jgi:hypothetical protein
MNTIQAKYYGTCATTGKKIIPGDMITFKPGSKKPVLVTPKTGINYITLNNQGRYKTYTQNYRGRCIDAPCCGCCTI